MGVVAAAAPAGRPSGSVPGAGGVARVTTKAVRGVGKAGTLSTSVTGAPVRWGTQSSRAVPRRRVDTARLALAVAPKAVAITGVRVAVQLVATLVATGEIVAAVAAPAARGSMGPGRSFDPFMPGGDGDDGAYAPPPVLRAARDVAAQEEGGTAPRRGHQLPVVEEVVTLP